MRPLVERNVLENRAGNCRWRTDFVVSGRLTGVGQCHMLKDAVTRLRHWAYPVGSLEI